jgi:UrcA family protein
MSSQSMSLVLAVALSAMSGAFAHAQPADLSDIADQANSAAPQTHSETVRYADLNLSGQAGVRTLMARIRSAAEDVCEPAPSGHELDSSYDTCVKSAVDHAIADVRRPTLTAMNQPGR